MALLYVSTAILACTAVLVLYLGTGPEWKPEPPAQLYALSDAYVRYIAQEVRHVAPELPAVVRLDWLCVLKPGYLEPRAKEAAVRRICNRFEHSCHLVECDANWRFTHPGAYPRCVHKVDAAGVPMDSFHASCISLHPVEDVHETAVESFLT